MCGEKRFKEAFELSTSSNAEIFVFDESWDHRRSYQAVMNAQFDMLRPMMESGKPWAMIADWRSWLVQVPEAERICIRSMKRMVARGLTHYGVLCDNHPVTHWQLERLAKQNPSLKTAVFYSIDDAISWLDKNHFDTNFKTQVFKPEWLQASSLFDEILDELQLEPALFKTEAL